MTYLDRILRSDKVSSFGTASAIDVVRFQMANGIVLSDAFRLYLERCNGMSTRFDFDEVRAADQHMALADINTIYGIGNGQSHADMALLLPRIDEEGLRLSKFAPAIGVGGDLCTFVEISRGRYAEQIMYTDGEMYWGYVQEIDWSLSVDESIGQFIDDGFFMPVANDFDALLGMYAELV